MEIEHLQRARPLLGTLVEISVAGADRAQLQHAVERAFRVIDRVHALMSFHASGSDVTRLNRRAHRGPVRVHPWTFAVLREARRTALASRGLFDVTVAARLVRNGLLPAPRGIPHPHPRGSERDIVLQPGNRVWFRRPLLIDLSGIAKGYAVDRALRVLRASGVEEALVNAGGDLACFGSHAQPVHVRMPDGGGLIPLAQLCNAALATSAGTTTCRTVRGKLCSAHVHPAGRSVPCDTSVSAVARRCVTADAWTKVILADVHMLGPARRAGVRAYILRADGIAS